MAITAEVEVASVDIGDAYDVVLWQHRKVTSYTPAEARELAADLVTAAAEVERIEAEDRAAAFDGHTCQIIAPNGEPVL